jgi:hypothetical protein
MASDIKKEQQKQVLTLQEIHEKLLSVPHDIDELVEEITGNLEDLQQISFQIQDDKGVNQVNFLAVVQGLAQLSKDAEKARDFSQTLQEITHSLDSHLRKIPTHNFDYKRKLVSKYLEHEKNSLAFSNVYGQYQSISLRLMSLYKEHNELQPVVNNLSSDDAKWFNSTKAFYDREYPTPIQQTPPAVAPMQLG